ncbi:MAG: GGDEF domain-containing protein [Pseudomonadota bacterium]
MVEVDERPAGAPAGDQNLRERVVKLTKELDWLESRHRQVCDVFRQAIGVMVGAAGPDLPAAVSEASQGLKQAAAAVPVDHKALGAAVERLKNALMAPAGQGDSSVESAEVKGEGVTAGGGPASHIALAMLEGLRLGQPEFDTHLEQSITLVGDYMQQGRVRPVMGVLADLLDHYRGELDRRRLAAEKALKEVVEEVMTAESEMAAFFQQTRDNLDQAGREHSERLTGQMGRLVQDIGSATNLDQLKSAALDHIRALRDQIREHRSREQSLLARTQEELSSLQTTLNKTRQRMNQVEQASQVLSAQALTDPLTAIWNKRALNDKLAECLGKEGFAPLCLIVFDIDKFKGINDTFGHQAGDRALKAIATQAGANLRSNDVLFRYAGDEFVIVLIRAGLEDAKAVAERVRLAAEAIRFTWRGSNELRITISMGLAQARPGDTPESLFERADQALLQAKRAGRNQVVTA